jgi:hypothetical protein
MPLDGYQVDCSDAIRVIAEAAAKAVKSLMSFITRAKIETANPTRLEMYAKMLVAYPWAFTIKELPDEEN